MAYQISSPSKGYFASPLITKADVVSYYAFVFKRMLPLIKDRAITLHKFPLGIGKEGFMQKNFTENLPLFMQTASVKKLDGSTIRMLLCNNLDSLKYMVNQGGFILHAALNKKEVAKPDKIIFDFDPSTKNFAQVKEAAFMMKELLEQKLKLKCFVMTTGSKGLHVIVPISPRYSYEEIRAFAKKVAEHLCRLYPKKYTIEVRKNKRGKRIFLDYLRNSLGQTAIAPYSLRAIKKAPIAMPIFWKELEEKNFNSQSFTLLNVKEKMKGRKDPFAKINSIKQSLAFAKKALAKLSCNAQ